MWDLDLLDTYMKNRFIVLFDHSYDPLNTGWQQTRSLLTLGGGRIFGQGLFRGTQTQKRGGVQPAAPAHGFYFLRDR